MQIGESLLQQTLTEYFLDFNIEKKKNIFYCFKRKNPFYKVKIESDDTSLKQTTYRINIVFNYYSYLKKIKHAAIFWRLIRQRLKSHFFRLKKKEI